MVQLEIQGNRGRSVTRQDMINYKANDGDISERLFTQDVHSYRVNGISHALESMRDKGLVLWVGKVSEEGWGQSQSRGGAHPRFSIL